MTQNGFLTSSDKAFLRGKKEYESNQGRYDRRRAIAERTRQAFHDFALLYETLNRHERDRIFDPPEKEVPEMRESIIKMIAFLYRSIDGDIGSLDRIHQRSFQIGFKGLLESGLRDGEARRQADDLRPFDIEYEGPEIDVVRPTTVDRDQVAHDLALTNGRRTSDEELRAAIKVLAKDTKSPSEHMIGDTPITEHEDFEDGIFDLYDLADRIKEIDEKTNQKKLDNRWRDIETESTTDDDAEE